MLSGNSRLVPNRLTTRRVCKVAADDDKGRGLRRDGELAGWLNDLDDLRNIGKAYVSQVRELFRRWDWRLGGNLLSLALISLW